MCVENDYNMTFMENIKFLLAPLKHSVMSLTEFTGIKIIFTLVVSFISYFVHENVLGVAVLVGLVAVDQFTGVWLAIKKKIFSSNGFRAGIIKLLFYIIIVAAFHSLTKVNPTFFAYLALDTAALSYLAVTEVISIVENSSAIIGIPFPTWIKEKLSVFLKSGKTH